MAEVNMDGPRRSKAQLARRGGGGGGPGGGSRSGSGRNHIPGPSSDPSSSSTSRSLNVAIRGASSDTSGRGKSRGGGSGRREAKRVDPLAGDKEQKKKSTQVDTIRTWLAKRYKPEIAMLDLSGMPTDPYLLEREVFLPGHKLTRTIVARVLWKLVGELQPPPITISYENNNLQNLDSLEYLTTHVRTVRNFSIARNPLRETSSIKTLVSLKTGLQELRELITTDTPLREKEIAAKGEDTYRNWWTSQLPFLRILDGAPIFSISFDVSTEEVPPSHASTGLATSVVGQNSDAGISRPVPAFPFAMKQNFISADADFVNGFLAKFFPLFDTARPSLSPIYLPTSTFSLTICTNIAPRARQAGLHHSLPNQKNLTWKPYTTLSRNLLRLNKLDERVNRLSHGTEAILKTFTSKGADGVPTTKHPIEDGTKWSVDSFAMETGSGGPVLLVTVHGEFEEMPAMGIRSFDRSFILSPAPPESPALAAGWPCVILSDQLTVRLYAASTAWLPTSIEVIPSAQPLPVPPVAVTDDQKSILLAQLSEKSGLNVQFSLQCLEGNDWDLERAWANFMELKPQIPKEAYV